ncbi:MAG TPA: type II toxin-antitoxin system RelE/ParE family toxin [Pirellulaceae bacterium]
MAKRQIRYRSEAIAELQKTEQWYRERDEQAADHWLAAAGQIVEDIAEHPELWAQDKDGIREVLIRPFSYTVVYRLHADVVEIVAFAHTSRRRRYWKKRLDS